MHKINLRVLINALNPRFFPSLTSVLVKGSDTTLSCPHPNSRLQPGIYHDGKFDKEMKDIHVVNAKTTDSGRYECDYGDKKDNKVKWKTRDEVEVLGVWFKQVDRGNDVVRRM